MKLAIAMTHQNIYCFVSCNEVKDFWSALNKRATVVGTTNISTKIYIIIGVFCLLKSMHELSFEEQICTRNQCEPNVIEKLCWLYHQL